MADPISIVLTVGSLSKAAYNVATALAGFISDTKVVSQTLKDLSAEITGLTAALKTVETGLSSPIIQSAEVYADKFESLELWMSINGSLVDCRSTIERLSEAIGDDRVEHTNVAKRAIRQFKLNLKDSEIASLRNQVRSHTTALQMTLQMLNVRASYMAPRVIASDLGPQIDSLRKLVMQLKESMVEDVHAGAPSMESLTIIASRTSEKLQQSANRVLSSATTVYSMSETGGSINGAIMDANARLKTMQWIPEPTNRNDPFDTNSSVSFSPPPTSGDASGHDTASSFDFAVERGDVIVEASDSDDDFEREVAERYLSRGSNLFDEEKYEEAELILKKGIKQADHLTLKQRSKLDLNGAIHKMIACLYHSDNLEEAETQLLNFTEQSSNSEKDAIQICDAAHLLSQLYLRTNRLDTANAYCRKALIGRRRILGKSHPQYFKSLNLLSKICEADSRIDEAQIYLGMIPAELRPSDSSPNDMSGKSTINLASVSTDTSPIMHRTRSESPKEDEEEGDDDDDAATWGEFPDFGSVSTFSPEPRFPPSLSSQSNSSQRRGMSPSSDIASGLQVLGDDRSLRSPDPPPISGNSPQILPSSAVLAPDLCSNSSLTLVNSVSNTKLLDWSLLQTLSKMLPIQSRPNFKTLNNLECADPTRVAAELSGFRLDTRPFITSLHVASAIGHRNAVEIMLLKGIPVDTKAFRNQGTDCSWLDGTPLHLAVRFNQIEVAQLLLSHGADVNAADSKNYRPLHFAAAIGQADIAGILLDRGAIRDVRDKNGRTAMHLAANSGFNVVVRLLLSRFANPNVQDREMGWTPLHYAAGRGHISTVQLLASNGANTMVIGHNLMTPRQTAKHFGHGETSKFLKNYKNTGSLPTWVKLFGDVSAYQHHGRS